MEVRDEEENVEAEITEEIEEQGIKGSEGKRSRQTKLTIHHLISNNMIFTTKSGT